LKGDEAASFAFRWSIAFNLMPTRGRVTGRVNPPWHLGHSVTGSSSRRGKATISTYGNMLCLTLIDVMLPLSSVLTKRTPQRSPEVLAVFFAGFDVQFQILSSHFLILTLSVSMNMPKAGTKGMSAGKLPREECASAGGFSC